MPHFKTKEEAYEKCEVNGYIRPRYKVDIEKIEANLNIAEENHQGADLLYSKKFWNSAYKLYYDAIHILIETFLIFDKVKSSNHQCLYAYLCIKHQELELDWDFFEKIRTKRNGINYYGRPVSKEDLEDIKLQTKIYINCLKKIISKKLKEANYLN